ncbi:hypothetical protein H5410_057828 [Solanum commersonii]|uniref:Uncharacterized protein n=1 Tax=Solanum commersonii TaxID=4109 RepID=A0A9J5WRY1_SOLCO|nr:hypothetical protein H5410_057828 [Solanum commersonii]
MSESIHEPVKPGGKMEVTVVEGGDSRESDKGPLVQMEDAIVINVGVNDEVNLEIVRIEENNAELAHQQMPSEQLENSMGSVVLTRKDEEQKNQDMKVVCFKSQPVQTLHEMVSHQGVVEDQEMVNSNAIENSEEKEVLQIDYKAFQEAGISHSSSVTLRGKSKGEVLPTRSNSRRGTMNGCK